MADKKTRTKRRPQPSVAPEYSILDDVDRIDRAKRLLERAQFLLELRWDYAATQSPAREYAYVIDAAEASLEPAIAELVAAARSLQERQQAA